ncbi:MAG: tetratricopeptide repeat protein [Candidatus Schekmanbacteria bacterium]|nr:tetratricopeptide repeat protein [Candidatus Schekmanbacteria bacterium]
MSLRDIKNHKNVAQTFRSAAWGGRAKALRYDIFSRKTLTSGIKYYFLLLSLWLISSCSHKSVDEMKIAADFLAKGDYQQALQQYQIIAGKNNNPETKVQALFWMADINLLYLNNPKEAVRNFETITLDYPNHPLALKSYWKVATIFQDTFNEKQEAILKYQELIDHFPQAPEAAEAQLAISNCYAHLGDPQQALVEARYLIDNYPKSPLLAKAYLFMGETCFMNKDYTKAREYYQKIIREFPQHESLTEAWMGLALVQENFGENKDALESYNQIKDTYPNKELVARRIKRLQDTIEAESKKTALPTPPAKRKSAKKKTVRKI